MNAFLQWLLAVSRRNPIATFCLVLLVLLGGADWFLWKRWGRLAVETERTRQEGEAMLLSLSSHPRIQAQSADATRALASGAVFAWRVPDWPVFLSVSLATWMSSLARTTARPVRRAAELNPPPARSGRSSKEDR